MSFFFTAEEQSLIDSVRYQTSREFEHLKNIKSSVNEQVKEQKKMQDYMRSEAEKWKQNQLAAETALEILNEQGVRKHQKRINLRKETVIVKKN